jgi:hypothetical protein
MKRSSRMTIQQATQDYERWLAGSLEIVPEDLAAKHERVSEAVFLFLRATYYRWAQLFPHLCKELGRAPQVLAVGDLHVENFGTWRDAEGRLVWGINDFDETWRLPYVHDLVRLATSAHLAIDGGHLQITAKEACESLLGGYREGLEAGGRPFVLAEHSKALREMATARLADPHKFWEKLDRLPDWKGEVPPRAAKALASLLPRPDLPRRVVHRVAGLGSLGRQRFVAIADWQGGRIAREAKALAPSAALWAHGGEGSPKVLYQTLLDQSVRSLDPWVKVRRRWVVRRLAPDCSRIELSELPEEREETRLLWAMGWETANVHLGSRSAHAMLVDLAAREPDWLHQAAKVMLAAVQEDWEAWRKQPAEPAIKAVRLAGAGAPDAAASAAAGGGTLVVLPPAGARGVPGTHGSLGSDGSDGADSPDHGSEATAGAAATGEPSGAGKAGKGSKPSKGEDKSDKAGKRDKGRKGDKSGKRGKGGKGGKQMEAGKAGKQVKAAKAVKAGKGDKPRKGAKAGKGAARAEEKPKPAASGGRAKKTRQGQPSKAVASAVPEDAGGATDKSAKKPKQKARSA